MHAFCSNYISWSNQGKYYEIEIQFAKQVMPTWLYDEAKIILFVIFFWKHISTGKAGWLPRSRSLTQMVGISDNAGEVLKISSSLK